MNQNDRGSAKLKDGGCFRRIALVADHAEENMERIRAQSPAGGGPTGRLSRDQNEL
jgi:hypothetical protein